MRSGAPTSRSARRNGTRRSPGLTGNSIPRPCEGADQRIPAAGPPRDRRSVTRAATLPTPERSRPPQRRPRPTTPPPRGRRRPDCARPPRWPRGPLIDPARTRSGSTRGAACRERTVSEPVGHDRLNRPGVAVRRPRVPADLLAADRPRQPIEHRHGDRVRRRTTEGGDVTVPRPGSENISKRLAILSNAPSPMPSVPADDTPSCITLGTSSRPGPVSMTMTSRTGSPSSRRQRITAPCSRLRGRQRSLPARRPRR